MGGNTAATAASTTREENPGAGAGEQTEGYRSAILSYLRWLAAPEEPSLESSASPSIRMSLNMGSLTSSGSNLFKEEDAAIKGGEVTLNFTDEAAGKEFRLNVRRQMPPHAHPDPHSSLTSGLPPRPIPSQFAVGQTVEFVKAKIKDEWERLDVGADAPVEVRMSCRTRPSSERRPGHSRPPPKMRPLCHRVSSWSSTARL